MADFSSALHSSIVSATVDSVTVGSAAAYPSAAYPSAAYPSVVGNMSDSGAQDTPQSNGSSQGSRQHRPPNVDTSGQAPPPRRSARLEGANPDTEAEVDPDIRLRSPRTSRRGRGGSRGGRSPLTPSTPSSSSQRPSHAERHAAIEARGPVSQAAPRPTQQPTPEPSTSQSTPHLAPQAAPQRAPEPTPQPIPQPASGLPQPALETILESTPQPAQQAPEDVDIFAPLRAMAQPAGQPDPQPAEATPQPTPQPAPHSGRSPYQATVVDENEAEAANAAGNAHVHEESGDPMQGTSQSQAPVTPLSPRTIRFGIDSAIRATEDAAQANRELVVPYTSNLANAQLGTSTALNLRMGSNGHPPYPNCFRIPNDMESFLFANVPSTATNPPLENPLPSGYQAGLWSHVFWTMRFLSRYPNSEDAQEILRLLSTAGQSLGLFTSLQRVHLNSYAHLIKPLFEEANRLYEQETNTNAAGLARISNELLRLTNNSSFPPSGYRMGWDHGIHSWQTDGRSGPFSSLEPQPAEEANLGGGSIPPARGAQPAAAGNVPPAAGAQQAAAGNVPQAAGNVPPAGAAQPAAAGNVPPAAGAQQAAAGNVPQAAGNVPPAGAAQPAAAGNVPPAAGAQQAAAGNVPQAAGNVPPAGAAQPAAAGNVPTGGARPAGGVRPHARVPRAGPPPGADGEFHPVEPIGVSAGVVTFQYDYRGAEPIQCAILGYRKKGVGAQFLLRAGQCRHYLLCRTSKFGPGAWDEYKSSHDPPRPPNVAAEDWVSDKQIVLISRDWLRGVRHDQMTIAAVASWYAPRGHWPAPPPPAVPWANERLELVLVSFDGGATSYWISYVELCLKFQQAEGDVERWLRRHTSSRDMQPFDNGPQDADPAQPAQNAAPPPPHNAAPPAPAQHAAPPPQYAAHPTAPQHAAPLQPAQNATPPPQNAAPPVPQGIPQAQPNQNAQDAMAGLLVAIQALTQRITAMESRGELTPPRSNPRIDN